MAERDDLTLEIKGRKLSGWTSIRVSRGIERCPSDFEIEMTDPAPVIGLFPVHPGDPCQVRLGGNLVLTGYVDRVTPSISADSQGGHHSIHVIGRSKCADLVDCAAEWPGGQITGSSVLEIARKLVLPYGMPNDPASAIRVSTDVADVGPVIPQFNLLAGETPFEIIERVCRYAALAAYDEPDGNLFLTRVGKMRAASGFVQGENVESAAVSFSMDQRFSVVECFIQSFDTFADLGDGGNLRAVVTDSGVPRHRKKIIIAESGDSDFEVSKRRASWEVVRRYGRAHQVHLVTDSWRDASGALWAPNTLVPVSLPGLNLKDCELLISEVTYLRDGQRGTTAELILMPAEAFFPEPTLLVRSYTDVMPVPSAGGDGRP